MDALFVGIVLSVTAGISFAVNRGEQRRRRALLRQVLADSRLDVDWEQVTDPSHGLRGQVAGREGLTLDIGKMGNGYRVRVDGLGVVRPLHLSTEDIARKVGKAVGRRDVYTGDTAFDEAVWIGGPEHLALARLDAETRACALAVFHGSLASFKFGPVLAEGHLDVTLDEPPDVGSLMSALEAVLALARRLEPPRALPKALAENATKDPLPGVRLANLRALGREFSDEWATRDACVHACSDPDEQVALAGALALADQGRDTLLRLAREAVDVDAAVRAIEALGAALPADELFEVFKRSRERRLTRKTVACIVALAAHPDGVSLPEVEKLLIADLRAREEGLPEAAARALGRLGSTDAVLPLREVENQGGALRAGARQAVAEIQSRLSGASPGQVSLSAGEAGQVSLADDASGRLSVREKG